MKKEKEDHIEKEIIMMIEIKISLNIYIKHKEYKILINDNVNKMINDNKTITKKID